MTTTFECLSISPDNITPEMLQQVVLMYSKTSSANTVHEARCELFSKGTRSLENIPPTQGPLRQHVRREAFQAGYVWIQALISQPELPSPVHCNWEQMGEGWTPRWTDLPQASKVCYELINCGYKTWRGRCMCVRANFKYTGICPCAGHCCEQKR